MGGWPEWVPWPAAPIAFSEPGSPPIRIALQHLTRLVSLQAELRLSGSLLHFAESGRSFREIPLELLEDRGGAGIGFRILLPHGGHQEASQSLPLLLRQMGAQDPAGLGQQGVRVRANRAYGDLTHRRTFYDGPSCLGQPPLRIAPGEQSAGK